jgi:hypothetical protein
VVIGFGISIHLFLLDLTATIVHHKSIYLMYLFKAFLFTSFISSAYCEATIQGTITTKNGHEYYVATYRTGAKPMTTDSSRIMEDKPMYIILTTLHVFGD